MSLYLPLSRAGIALLAIGTTLPQCYAQANPPAAPAPATSPVSPTGKIDPEALALLKKVETTMLGLKTYQAECWTTVTDDPEADGTRHKPYCELAALVAVKPNLMRYEVWQMTPSSYAGDVNGWQRQDETPVRTFICDGNTYWQQFGTSYHADKHTEPLYMTTYLEPWEGFYSKMPSPYSMAISKQSRGELLEARREGTEVVDGVTCDRILIQTKAFYVWRKSGRLDKWGKSVKSTEHRTYWYIAADGLVHRKLEVAKFSDRPGRTRDAILRHIVVNAPAPDSKAAFTYMPPPGVKLRGK